MFARTLRIVVTGVALVFGTACKGPDHPTSPSELYFYLVSAWGANVIPMPAPADTSARASAGFNAETGAYSYSVTVAPSGTIDSIAFYQVPAGTALPASATAILCAGAAACTATSGTATLVPPATLATIRTSMLAFGTQIVFFTTTAQKSAGGAMRGTMYVNP